MISLLSKQDYKTAARNITTVSLHIWTGAVENLFSRPIILLARRIDTELNMETIMIIFLLDLMSGSIKKYLAFMPDTV